MNKQKKYDDIEFRKLPKNNNGTCDQSKKHRKCLCLKIALGVLFLILIEVSLRIAGFGQMPLYTASNEWEYMTTPNQSGYRLGNRFYINSYGMRCDEVDSTKQIILGLGDSVIFGGAQTDQDSLATSLFTNETGIQMLNISAGSWGPDNCAAFLKHYGLFNAKAMLLVVSSHDAHDIITHEPVVDIHPSYPSKQFCCATIEVFSRYVLPRLEKSAEKDPDQKVLSGSEIRKDGIPFNPGFDQLKAMCDSAHIPMVVYLHAEKTELAVGKYNDQGDEIIRWCNNNNVNLIKDLDNDLSISDFRDNIHLSSHGQRNLANQCVAFFRELCNKKHLKP